MTERLKKSIIIFLEKFLCFENIPSKLINATINYQEAKNIASKEVENLGIKFSLDLILIEQSTVTKEFGWIFFYNSKEYYYTKDEKFALSGNAPFIVDNRDGRIVGLGTADSILYYSKLYREYRDNHEDFNKYLYNSFYSDNCWLLDVFGWIIIPIRNRLDEIRWKKMK
ncbi:MAG: YrhB domain-containing protein [Bacteroidales bacterium]